MGASCCKPIPQQQPKSKGPPRFSQFKRPKWKSEQPLTEAKLAASAGAQVWLQLAGWRG